MALSRRHFEYLDKMPFRSVCWFERDKELGEREEEDKVGTKKASKE